MTPRHPRTWLALAATVLLSCSATPVPEPPSPGGPAVDFGAVDRAEVFPASNTIDVATNAGASPPGARLRVTNLDGTDPPVETIVDDDGSFAVSVAGEEGDELRFRAELEGFTFTPVDVVWENGTFTPSTRISCVTLDPQFEIDFETIQTAGSGSSSIEVRNDCGEDLGVSQVRTRLSAAEITLGSLPSPINNTLSGRLDVEFRPTGTGRTEDTVFIELTTSSESARYPITVIGRAE